jgi:hypothetical protein
VLPETSTDDHSDPSFEVKTFYFVSETKVDTQLESRGSEDWLIAFKDVTSAISERTAIFTFIPRVGVGHSASLIFSNEPIRKKVAFVASLNSLILDFCARSKVGGLHLTFFYLKQLPIPPPAYYSEAYLDFINPRALELTYTSHSMAPFARDLGYEGAPFAWDEDRRALLRAELDAWFARAYGLTREELRYILDPADVMGSDYPSETFRVLKNNEERKYGEYLTRRLVLDAWDRMERGELHFPAPYDRSKDSVLNAPASPAFALTSPKPRPHQPGLNFDEAEPV